MTFVILTASVLRIYVKLAWHKLKLPDDDTEISKHVEVFILILANLMH